MFHGDMQINVTIRLRLTTVFTLFIASLSTLPLHSASRLEDTQAERRLLIIFSWKLLIILTRS